MNKKLILPIIIISVLCGLGVFILQNLEKQTGEVKAGSTHNVFGFAWAGVPQASGEKLGLGWISFNCNTPELPTPRCSQTNYGVNIESNGNLTGYAYFDMDDPNTPEHEVGWIDFDPTVPSTMPGSSDFSARVDLDGSVCGEIGWVCGWAKALNYDGSWDGWIKLRKDPSDSGPDYGVYIDPATGEFHGWAWGDDVMGWISFNCQNRGVCSSSTAEGGPSNYKVYTTFSFNASPTVTNLKVTPYYCDYSPNTWINLSWDYNDPEGTPQSAYQIQIATDSGFSNIIYNTGQVSSSGNNHWLQPAIGAGGPLSYGQTYYWRVKVWDQDNQASEWSASNCPYVITLNQDETTQTTTCFRTASHAWPEVSFSFEPDPPTVDEVINFSGEATPYGGASITSWYWTFAPDGNPYHASTQNVQVTFPTDGDKNVTLQVTDSSNYTCQEEETINVKLPLPGIIEIPPK